MHTADEVIIKGRNFDRVAEWSLKLKFAMNHNDILEYLLYYR